MKMDDLINLSHHERSALEAALRGGADAKVFQRAQALLLIDEGAGVIEVAELLRGPRQTVYNWLLRFQTRRTRPVVQRLGDASRDGRPATVGELIDELLDEVLETDPCAFGYRSTF
jgi:hypothetical protein